MMIVDECASAHYVTVVVGAHIMFVNIDIC